MVGVMVLALFVRFPTIFSTVASLGTSNAC